MATATAMAKTEMTWRSKCRFKKRSWLPRDGEDIHEFTVEACVWLVQRARDGILVEECLRESTEAALEAVL